jgi:hypothetical protein
MEGKQRQIKFKLSLFFFLYSFRIVLAGILKNKDCLLQSKDSL